MDKSGLRLHFKELAKAFFSAHSEAELEVLHKTISQRLFFYCEKTFSLLERKDAKVALYHPLRFELPVAQIVCASGAWINPTFLFPQIDGSAMWFEREGKAAEPDFVIVPGLFVDGTGHRLGRGKGYYDRYFREKKTPIERRLFLGYDFQFIAAVPVTTLDESVCGIYPRPK